MTPTPPSATTSSNGVQSPDGQFRIVRKRNRVPLSCAPCRSRKLKCNRTQPCENCVKRGDALQCSYATPGSRKKHSTTSSSSNSPGDMQNRIDRLEGLVLSLMTNGAQSQGPAAANRTLSMSNSTGSMEYPQDIDVNDVHNPNGMMRPDGEGPESDTDQVAQSLGVLKVYDNKSMYFGEAHWATVLQDIAEVKNYFAEHKKQLEEQAQKVQALKSDEAFPQSQSPTFLLGGVNPPEFSELLNSLPKRVITDKLVHRYFSSFDPAVHILHPSSWLKYYEAFWADPHAMGAAWLGQIYAVLCLAMHSYYKMGDEPPEYRGKSLILANKYRSLTAQSLLRADYLKPSNHMIETLILHLHGEYARNRDADVAIWVLVGMIVRLAMRMGYHRDSKLFSNVTPFQGEMRRRIWTFVRQSDILFSFQLGLPSMIRLADCDTALPGNYYDEDLFEDMKALPPSRPVTEPTPASYMIAKASLTFCFGKIVETLHAISPCSYEDIMQLDQNLREARAELPPHLRLKPVEDCMLDPGAIVMQRFFLSILYHKGQCVLHRKFLARARENPKYLHSRRTCVDSSMELLNHQATLHYESQEGCRLHNVRVLLSSLTSHDFLLAAMIIALDLWQGAEADTSGRNSADIYTWGLERREDEIHALEVSQGIWKETRDQSMESYKASEILTIILNKMKDQGQSNASGRPGAPGPFPFPSLANGNTLSPYPNPMDDKPEHSAAMTLGMLSSGGLTPNTSGALFNNGYPNPQGNEMQNQGLGQNYGMEQIAATAASPFSFMTGGAQGGDMPANIDWDAWDSYIQNAGIDTTGMLPFMDTTTTTVSSAATAAPSGNNHNAPAPTATMSPPVGIPAGSAGGGAGNGQDHGQQQGQGQIQNNNLFASPNSPFVSGVANMPI